MSLADKPVFPVEDVPENFKGMTLLEHYAGLAMQGLLADDQMPHLASDHGLLPEEYVARASVAFARALIAELEKQP